MPVKSNCMSIETGQGFKIVCTGPDQGTATPSVKEPQTTIQSETSSFTTEPKPSEALDLVTQTVPVVEK
jgi:hypothetical protein